MIELPVTLTSTGGAVSFASPVPLGYTKNKGVYRLLVTAEGEWEGLTIRCFWHLPGGADPASSLVQDGAVDVPASVTAHPGNGCITFEGSDGVKTVTSADLRYRVGSNSGTEDGTMPEPGTPAWEQLVSETAVALESVQKQIGNLDDLTTKAKETLVAAINEAARTGSGVAGSITMRTDGGYIQYSTDDGSTWENLIALAELKGEPGQNGADGAPGQNGADGAPGADGYSPAASVEQIADGAKITITDKSGTTEAVVKNGKDGANGRDGADGKPGRDGTDGAPGRDGVDGQPGKDGKDGITPTIGDNGNWYLGGTDTGKPSRGADGATGATGATGEKGTDGKSAYQYALEGGYTGTEAEFSAKLAQEIPKTLPNPNALTFTGAVTGSYDGSAPLSVEIPSGGGGSAYELPVASATQLGGVMPVAKTDEMTQAVGVDAEGGLWALPGGGSMKMELLAELRGDGEGISFSATFDGIEKPGLYLIHFGVKGADAENAGDSLYAKFGGSGIWGNGIRSVSILTTNNQYDSKVNIMLIATDDLGNAYQASGAERGLNDSLGSNESENRTINGVVSLYSQNSKPVFSGASVRLWRLL